MEPGEAEAGACEPRANSPLEGAPALEAPRPASRPAAFATALEVLLACAAAISLALGPLAAWTHFLGRGLALAGAAYSALLLAAGRRLWRGPHSSAGGVLVAAAALMVPFSVHGLEHAVGFFPPSSSPPGDLLELVAHPTFLVDVAAVGALSLAAWRFPFPPLAAMVIGALCLLGLDAAHVFGQAPTWTQRAMVPMSIGAMALAVAAAADHSPGGRRFASWIYPAALLALCGGLVTSEAESGAAMASHAAIALLLLVLAPLLQRSVLAAFGALTLADVFGRWAARSLDGTGLVACAIAVGGAIVLGGLAWRGVERRLDAALRAHFAAPFGRAVRGAIRSAAGWRRRERAAGSSPDPASPSRSRVGTAAPPPGEAPDRATRFR